MSEEGGVMNYERRVMCNEILGVWGVGCELWGVVLWGRGLGGGVEIVGF